MAFEMFIIDVSVWLHSENSTGWQMKANSIIHLVNDKLDDCKVMKMLVCGEWGHCFKQNICVCVSQYFISHIIGKQADKWRKMFGLRKKTLMTCSGMRFFSNLCVWSKLSILSSPGTQSKVNDSTTKRVLVVLKYTHVNAEGEVSFCALQSIGIKGGKCNHWITDISEQFCGILHIFSCCLFCSIPLFLMQRSPMPIYCCRVGVLALKIPAPYGHMVQLQETAVGGRKFHLNMLT